MARCGYESSYLITTSFLQLICLVYLCDIYVLGDGPDSEQIIRFCLDVLRETHDHFPFIGPLRTMFSQSIQAMRLSLADDVEELFGNRKMYGTEDFLDVCGRLTYAQPIDLPRNQLDRSFVEDFEVEWTRLIENKRGTKGWSHFILNTIVLTTLWVVGLLPSTQLSFPDPVQ